MVGVYEAVNQVNDSIRNNKNESDDDEVSYDKGGVSTLFTASKNIKPMPGH